MQRYRECHDFYHVITGPFPVTTAAELVVKWFELANMGLPVAALSAFFGPLRLNSGLRSRLVNTYVPWALRCGSMAKPLISLDWENRWEQPVVEMKRELGIWDPPMTWVEFKARGRDKRENIDHSHHDNH
jgi:ubiquinone biosynthesis protein COQ4